MNLGKLIRDKDLLPPLPKRPKPTVVQRANHAMRAEFLLRRGQAALAGNAALRGTGPSDVAASGVAPLKVQLATDVATAAMKMTTLTRTMADTSKTELVPLDDASVDPARRFKKRYMGLLERTPEQLRATAILSAGWLTLVSNLAITDADLHTLVSRRLMMTERMLWYVGRVENRQRKWDFAASHDKQWQDGWNRMFEYPRLPIAKPFNGLCRPATNSTDCDAHGVMAGWKKQFTGQFHHDLQINPTARPLWKPAEKFFFDKSVAGGHPVKAILDLFTVSERFDKRNLLMCDHVIDCLHLEALVRVKSKRDNDRDWLKRLTDVESDGWLRIIHPSLADDDPGAVAFLVGQRETRFFQRVGIRASELMVGDHVIVFNHPAYAQAKATADVWRLENAIVVTAFPRLLLQGHGTDPLPFTATRRIPVKDKTTLEPSMRLNMLSLFNKRLRLFRDAAKKENAKTQPRDVIDDFDSDAVVVRRTDVGPFSGYDPAAFTPATARLARWWIRWEQDSEQREPQIAADTVWAQRTWERSSVELTDGFGYFPLWLPKVDRRGNPVRKGGKISALKEVVVSQKMAAGYTWYYLKDESPDDEARQTVAARRPKVS